MKTLVDSSALYALTIAEDLHHDRAVTCFGELDQLGVELSTTNYVLLECVALIQRRYGMSDAQEFLKKVGALLDIVWIGQTEHGEAVKMWTAAGRRALSLVDCTNMAVMRQRHIRTIVAFDPHFHEAGFEVLPRADRVAEGRGVYRTKPLSKRVAR